MRRAASIFALLGALAALAVDPALLMRTHTDPSRMLAVPGVRWNDVMTAYLERDSDGFSAVGWLRIHPTNQLYITIPVTLWSVDAARPTRSGGPRIPATMEYQTVTDNSGGTFANPHYACPDALADQWQYGCYCVNIDTPVDVTVTIAGAERFVAASNGVKQVFNILGTAADYSWSVTGPTGGATPVNFGFGVNPLVKFYGINCQSDEAAYMADEGPGAPLVPNVTNEWVMAVSQAKIIDGKVIARMAYFTWGSEIFPSGWQTNEVNAACFAAGAFVRINTMHFGGLDQMRDFYGMKLFNRCLTDDELRNVRDLDMFEMQRRGMTRWRAQ